MNTGRVAIATLVWPVVVLAVVYALLALAAG